MNSQVKDITLILVLLMGITLQAQAKNAMHIVINNHLGTPEMLIDENQQVVWQAEYDEFGQATILVEQVEFNHRFPGQYYDKETGLSYNYYRDYDAENGRYVQSDPIGLAGGINTYGYVGGNPVSYVDPYGLLFDETGVYTATALATATATSTVTSVALASFGAGVLTYQMCNGDDEDKCKTLIAEIWQLMNIVDGRLSDLYIDTYDLYNLAYASPSPSLPKGTGSWKGHIKALNDAQQGLRNRISKAIKQGCKIPKRAWELAYAKVPNQPLGR